MDDRWTPVGTGRTGSGSAAPTLPSTKDGRSTSTIRGSSRKSARKAGTSFIFLSSGQYGDIIGIFVGLGKEVSISIGAVATVASDKVAAMTPQRRKCLMRTETNVTGLYSMKMFSEYKGETLIKPYIILNVTLYIPCIKLRTSLAWSCTATREEKKLACYQNGFVTLQNQFFYWAQGGKMTTCYKECKG